MSRSKLAAGAALIVAVSALATFGLLAVEEKPASGKERLFEMRTYTAFPEKLEALHARFRNHTNKLFVKHGMTLIGYWTPTEGPEAKNTLVYILAFPDRAAQEKAWKGFRDDPEWQKARDASERDGKLVEKVASVILKPTDYSPIK